jgi:hypothetical protein
MALAEAASRIFFAAPERMQNVRGSKKQRKTGHFSQFSLYSTRAIPYDSNEHPQKNPVGGDCSWEESVKFN